MLIHKGDLWEYRQTHCIIIPTNCVLRGNGSLVMGAGVALAACKVYQNLEAELGYLIKSNNNFCVYSEKHNVIACPTKRHYWDKSCIQLIQQSLQTIVKLADKHNLRQLATPALGCGLGGLQLSEVQPIMQQVLDDRFTLVV